MRGGGRGLGGNTPKVERGIIVFPPLIALTFCRSFVRSKGDDSRLLAFTLQWKREVLSHINSAIVLSQKIEPSGWHAPIFKQKCVGAKVVLRQPNNIEPSCCHVATSDRGCGWEDYPTMTLLPDGKRASGVRNVVITRRHRTPFYYLCGYAHPTYFIVRGNCEALGARCVAMARLTFRFVAQLRCGDYFAKKTYSYLVSQLACRKYCKNSLLIFLACDIINTYY